jgi:hypothetical protein
MGFKDPGYLERKSAATDARKAALEKFRANSAANDPAAAERQASRQAVSLAREQAERAARDAVAQAKRESAEKADREAVEEADRKAARDARYAARKKRNK